MAESGRIPWGRRAGSGSGPWRCPFACLPIPFGVEWARGLRCEGCPGGGPCCAKQTQLSVFPGQERGWGCKTKPICPAGGPGDTKSEVRNPRQIRNSKCWNDRDMRNKPNFRRFWARNGGGAGKQSQFSDRGDLVRRGRGGLEGARRWAEDGLNPGRRGGMMGQTVRASGVWREARGRTTAVQSDANTSNKEAIWHAQMNQIWARARRGVISSRHRR